jgi:hypothetical protein
MGEPALVATDARFSIANGHCRMGGLATIVRMHVHQRPERLELMLMHAISAR